MHAATSSPKPCRVLLIEDDPDDVYLFERALDHLKARDGRDVVLDRAGDGLDASYQVAIDDLTSRLPDVVVLDLNMPRLDGIKFLHALRATFGVRDLPVVVVTTSTAKPIHDQAMSAGADKVFIKPDDANALLEIAAEIIDRGLAFREPRA